MRAKNIELAERNRALYRQLLSLHKAFVNLGRRAVAADAEIAVLEGGRGDAQRPLEHPKAAAAAASRWAFVTMAVDAPGSAKYLWGALALARSLQRLSRFPLLVLTNATAFPGGLRVNESLARLNAHALPVHAIDGPCWPNCQGQRAPDGWGVAFWKLQIWNLTHFERLVWLDADSILYRSLDWLFEKPGMWGQRDDWYCQLEQPGLSTGLLLIYPNASDLAGLLRHGSTLGRLDDDRALVGGYFSEVRGEPVHLLTDLEASFGQCLGRAETPYRRPDGSPVRGIWSIPNFVHKSGGWGDEDHGAHDNVCFSPDIRGQYYQLAGLTINACQYNPLGIYWRGLFCEAAALGGLAELPEVGDYCSDACWYIGGEAACRHGERPAAHGQTTAAPNSTRQGERPAARGPTTAAPNSTRGDLGPQEAGAAAAEAEQLSG